MAKKLQPIQTAAKNVILFLGDGECARLVHTLSPDHPGILGCRLTQAGPRDSDLTQCTFRDGGFHGDSRSDPKGADGWQAGT